MDKVRPTVARCPTCKRRHKRTLPQNALYWELLGEISKRLKPQGQQFSDEVWHEYLKRRYLGADDVKLPNGKTAVIAKSTADCDVAEFGEYFDKVQAWAADHDVWLADREITA